MFQSRRRKSSRAALETIAAVGLMVVGLLAVVGTATAIAMSENPPADGFDLEGSDPKAIELADETMAAMGGREAWDSTRYIHWNFFGFRTHLWDKWTGDLRFQQQKQLVLMNIHDREGRVFQDGVEVTDPEEKSAALQKAYEAWINDSYWLAMPYKLKDSGVTLTYVGEQPMENGEMADVVQLTFEGVGVTPQNKYHVSISKESGLVEQWAFFAEASDAEPRFRTPWAQWSEHGDILLSGDRGERQITDIRVYEAVPESAFRDPAEPDWATFDRAR